VATELAKRDVTVPDDWADAYAEPHVDAPDGAEVPLPAHVSPRARGCGVDYEHNAARRAVVAAFDQPSKPNQERSRAVDAARERGRWRSVRTAASGVGRADARQIRLRARRFRRDRDERRLWLAQARPEIFELTADELGVAPADLIHVGDDPEADGGIEAVGGTALVLEERSLADVPARLATVAECSSHD